MVRSAFWEGGFHTVVDELIKALAEYDNRPNFNCKSLHTN